MSMDPTWIYDLQQQAFEWLHSYKNKENMPLLYCRIMNKMCLYGCTMLLELQASLILRVLILEAVEND
jgi:hypothetical protein